MAKIPKNSIKKLVKNYLGASITDDGADELAQILEKKANEISKFAVNNAKTKGREKVTKEDIKKYIITESDA
ncbi:MAG: histone-like protein [Candidatus Micrarchaeia archaeon]